MHNIDVYSCSVSRQHLYWLRTHMTMKRMQVDLSCIELSVVDKCISLCHFNQLVAYHYNLWVPSFPNEDDEYDDYPAQNAVR